MGTKHPSSDPVTGDTKRQRTGDNVPILDEGIEPNGCVAIYLVSRKKEVGSLNSFRIEPVDINSFFGHDGRIYGYQGLKITIWLSSVSFHAYADISFVSQSDGGNGITDLESSLQNIFALNLVESKDDFLQTFSTERNYVRSVVSKAEEMLTDTASSSSSNSDSQLIPESAPAEVFRVSGTGVENLYNRLASLVLLLVDGSNPIDVTDPQWELYTLVQKRERDSRMKLLGFAAVYRFYRYPDNMRLRIGQILILPPYQRKGYGGTLLKVLNLIAISDDVYDVSIEEPVDSLQHLRSCIDVQRLLQFEPIRQALNPSLTLLKNENLSKKSEPCQCPPPLDIVELARQILKINKRHFRQCWEILLYLGLNPIEQYMANFKTIIANRIRADVLGKESQLAGKKFIDIPTQYDRDASFAMFKSRDPVEKDDSNQDDHEEQLRELVDERMKQIKSIADKVSSLAGSSSV